MTSPGASAQLQSTQSHSVRAAQGTVLHPVHTLNDRDGRLDTTAMHFAVVVSSDAYNALYSHRVCAVLSHAETREGKAEKGVSPFAGHLCFIDEVDATKPARRLGLVESWNLIVLDSVALSKVQEMGLCCDHGLRHFEDLARTFMYGEGMDEHLRPLLDKRVASLNKQKRTALWDFGTVLKVVNRSSQRTIQVVLSCRTFHEALYFESAVVAELQPMPANAQRQVSWTLTKDDGSSVQYCLASPPYRLAHGALSSVEIVGQMSSLERGLMRRGVDFVLGLAR